MNAPWAHDPRARPGVGVEAGAELAIRFLREAIDDLRRSGVPVGEDDYRGLYTSETEVDRLLGTVNGAGALEGRSRMGALRAELTAYLADPPERLGRLAGLAPLGPLEAGTLLLCLACETRVGVERLVAYAQDDVTRRRPRVDLLVRLFGGGGSYVDAWDAFGAGAPLIRHRLVSLIDDAGQGATPLPSKGVVLDPRVAGYLLGSDQLAEPLSGVASLPAGAPTSLDLGLAGRLRNLAGADLGDVRTVVLGGPDRSLLSEASAALAAGWGRAPLLVDVPRLLARVPLAEAATQVLREAVLQHAVPVIEQVHDLAPADQAALASAIDAWSAVPAVAVTAPVGADWPGFRVEVGELDFNRRRSRWMAALGPDGWGSDAHVEAVAAKFRLDQDAIARAAALAKLHAFWRDPSGGAPSEDDLHAAARGQSAPILSGLAHKIMPRFGWEDLILPPDALDQLREISARVEHGNTVYADWGFERKLSPVRAVIALMAGNSGTGKTMAAEVMAGELGLDLYRIDLSAVVSKYIGETEKNLDSIFREAERSNAILFFDEADALFGKRSEVKDAHDRYANIETAYLLQRMEEYSGIVILATNLKMNLDDAFVRRLHFVVDFPMPDDSFRRRIWERALPSEAPTAGDIDWEFLARQFKVSGGNIKNAVVAAAFFAAGEAKPIGMMHLVRGMRREYQKLGRMVTEAEFGAYLAELSP